MNKKFIWLGIGALAIVIVIVGVVILNGNAKGPDSIIKQYCDILKKGNYGDIIDIAYFPESELITKEKLEEKKKQYFEEMRNSNNANVTKYEYSQTNEDDEKISYKVVLNGTDVINVDLLKSENKLLIEDLYEERSLKVVVDSKVSVDGVELTDKTPIDDYYDSYNFIALKGVDYEVKITHPYVFDIDTNLDLKIDTNVISLRPEIREKYNEDREEIFRAIVSTYQEGKDISDLNQYFLNNNAEEFFKGVGENIRVYGDAQYVNNYKITFDFYETSEVKGRPVGLLMRYGESDWSKTGIDFRVDENSNPKISLDFHDITFVLVDGKFKISDWNW